MSDEIRAGILKLKAEADAAQDSWSEQTLRQNTRELMGMALEMLDLLNLANEKQALHHARIEALGQYADWARRALIITTGGRHNKDGYIGSLETEAVYYTLEQCKDEMRAAGKANLAAMVALAALDKPQQGREGDHE